MKKFVKELATNRFGIVMATLNICYFLSTRFLHNLFSKKFQAAPFYLNENMFYWLEFYFPKMMININAPAILISSLPTFFVAMVSKIPATIENKLFLAFSTFFVIFQWLFIGWAAKKIAKKLSKSV